MNVPMNRSLMILIMACVSFENCHKLQMILVCNLLVSKYSPGLGDIGDIGTPEAVCWHNKVLRRCCWVVKITPSSAVSSVPPVTIDSWDYL